ncbi:restriction endonuclease subunit S [Mycobacterium sherrisii]|uniref:Restriction endonuclease subunit S n=1 Tax=Mycobacterium sherrisii TaxID=243061 RepID=A0A1E3STV0_9MYCO|nr:restriction endonuclease subunit S [Mycobacterium sherrisii]MCV7028846.1 restriction endonuclease subunit S [Mycobacterium sherrisii]MEC4761743.1 restriction endonuclease subunit S [Mycobacterium sherrisii]ODR05584.1 restriction endonuclease subunit S [Mycobacterium sherrisii]ORW82786.1 restriction endonuclease subunit S [Mycobacterium sherrisii]
MTATLGEHLDFHAGSGAPVRVPDGPFPVYGANGAIGFTARPNARGPLIVLGRVGSHCGSLHYCETDVWVTDNALACRAKQPAETRYWYYALQTCRLNEYRAGSGQPLLNQAILRDVSVRTVPEGQRQRIAELLGAFDDKIAANRRVIAAAEQLMVALVETVTDRVPLSRLAEHRTALRDPGQFDDVVAHFSLPAFDDGATPRLVRRSAVRSGKFVLSRPCVLFAKLNPRIPRIWNVTRLPTEMAVASPEFVVLTPIAVGTSALWAALRQRDVVDGLQQQVGGTSGSHQRIRRDDLMTVAVRDVRQLTGRMTRTLAGLGALCHLRRNESVRLSALRDAVLPSLISGDVRVRRGRSPG